MEDALLLRARGWRRKCIIFMDEQFTGCRSNHAPVAQTVEHSPEKAGVIGSTPIRGANDITSALKFFESSKYYKKLAEAVTDYFKHVTK